MAIRTLFMDIGGVVLFPDSRFWQQLSRDFGIPEDAEQQFYGETGPWKAVSVGQMTYDESLVALADMFHLNLEVVTRLRSDREWMPNAPMIAWLRAMKNNGHEIIAISNADTSLEERLELLQIADLFNHVVNSARVQAAKPDPVIYQIALGLTSSQPHECLLIDDKARNMPPAQALGIQTVVYTAMPEFLDTIQRVLHAAP